MTSNKRSNQQMKGMLTFVALGFVGYMMCGCSSDNNAQHKDTTPPSVKPAGQFVTPTANASDTRTKPDDHSTKGYRASKGIGLSYDQVTHLLADKFNLQDGVAVNGRRSTSGQDGYRGPLIEVIGDHNNVWETGIAIQSPKDVSKEIMIANAASMLLFMKNISPHWGSSINWLETALKRSEESPGSRIATSHNRIRYTVVYIGTKSATVLTAIPVDAPTDDILDSLK